MNGYDDEEFKANVDKCFRSWEKVRDKSLAIGLNPNIKFQDLKLDIENDNEVSDIEMDFYNFQQWLINTTSDLDLEPDFLGLMPPIPKPTENSKLINFLKSL